MKNYNLKDLLNKSEDVNIERLTEGKRVMTDAERERIFAMSKKKLENMKSGVSADMGEDNVNGVESYRRPVLTRFAGMAAAALLVVGGIGGGAYVAHNMKHTSPDEVVVQPATGVVTTSAVTVTTGTGTYTADTVTTANAADMQSKLASDEEKMRQQIETVAAEAQKAYEEEQKRKEAEEAAKAASEAAEAADAAASTAEAEPTTKNNVSAEDAALIEKAQSYYGKACELYWGYRYNFSDYVEVSKLPLGFSEDDTGFRYETAYDDNGNYLGVPVTDPRIKSIDDIMKLYESTFDSRYNDGYRDYFVEYKGNVYWKYGQRGGNIFYVDSVVTDVVKKEGDEITFTVANNYDGTGLDGTVPWTEYNEFSVIVGSDGEWKIGKFKLPY